MTFPEFLWSCILAAAGLWVFVNVVLAGYLVAASLLRTIAKIRRGDFDR